MNNKMILFGFFYHNLEEKIIDYYKTMFKRSGTTTVTTRRTSVGPFMEIFNENDTMRKLLPIKVLLSYSS